MKKIINIGLIGCGVVGFKRIKNLPKQFRLIGCADPLIHLKKKYIKKKNILLFKDWKNLIKLKHLDAVIISTTHSLHSKILNTCINLNIHSFIEKPGGISHIETKKILDRLKKKQVSVKVGFNHRYHPTFILAKKLISKNKIGKLMYIRAVYGHGGRLNYNKEWRFNKKISGGGELIDKGSHLIDLSRLFLGNLSINFCKLKTFFWKMKLEDNCFLNLENKKGAFAFLHASCTEWKNKFIFEIFGKDGKIEINGLGKSYGKETLIYYKMSKSMGIPKKNVYSFKNNENFSWKMELNDFYLDIIKKRKSTPNINDVYENLKIINKIYKNK